MICTHYFYWSSAQLVRCFWSEVLEWAYSSQRIWESVLYGDRSKGRFREPGLLETVRIWIWRWKAIILERTYRGCSWNRWGNKFQWSVEISLGQKLWFDHFWHRSNRPYFETSKLSINSRQGSHKNNANQRKVVPNDIWIRRAYGLKRRRLRRCSWSNVRQVWKLQNCCWQCKRLVQEP